MPQVLIMGYSFWLRGGLYSGLDAIEDLSLFIRRTRVQMLLFMVVYWISGVGVYSYFKDDTLNSSQSCAIARE